MNFKHFCSALFISVVIAATVSCKKDEDTKTKPSLSGSLRFKGLPEYISISDLSHDVFPIGVSHPDGNPIGYYWRLTPRTDNDAQAKNDTVSTADGGTTLVFKDSLYTCTVICGAFADGYYDSSVSTYTTIVRPGVNGSVTNAGFNSTSENEQSESHLHSIEITDDYTVVGGYKWMRRNLSSVSAKDGSLGTPFKRCDAMDDVFGKYYTYEEALTACPEGWELPDDEAWKALASSVNPALAETNSHSNLEGIAGAMMVNALFNARIPDYENGESQEEADKENAKNKSYIMWDYEPDVKISNSTGLSVLPVGYADKSGDSYIFKSSFKDSKSKARAMFVTGEEDGDKAYFRYITEGDNTLHIGKYDKKSFAASVRCVQKIN